ncbi:MAG: hypothetical protein JMN25_00360 [gamma proteobacterium endosymbiont of Lamellibrachia anaximandri]|nr:hypothetical protein [gamma proteobacterium endosymbiont of Lamellibrachia anaximandri]
MFHSKYRHAFLILATAVLFLVGVASTQAAAELPRVAIKPSEVGEKVSKYSRRYLNIQTLLSEMEFSINQTRKFKTLTRDKAKLAAIREEQQLAASELAKGNAASTGGLENANFLILPTVQDFKFYRSHKSVPNMDDKYFRTDSGLLEIQAQVIDTTTGQMKANFYMKASFATKRKMVNKKGGAPSSVYFSKMAKKVSAQMADQLVATVFPMKVIKIKGKKLTINRGGDGGLKKGTTLALFHVDEELFDPDTGVSLGKDETYIGKVKVTRVKPKYSVVKIIKLEEDEEIAVGDILRKPK